MDSVRGAALLASTVATALVWLGGRQLGPGFRPVDGTRVDRVVDAVTAVLVDNRALPVFALLLGYGVAVRMRTRARAAGAHGERHAGSQAGSQAGAHAGPDEVEWGDALRRAGVLLGLGALHAALVLEADVLGTLAVLLVLAVPLARARTRTHVLVVVLVVPALLVNGAVDGLGGTAGFPDAPEDYLLSVVDRVGTWLLGLVLLLPVQSGLVVAVVAGVRLARSGWGSDPAGHRRGLLLLGGLAGAIGVAGALPYARVLGAGVVPDVVDGLVAGVLGSVTGPAGALGAVCLGLAAATPGAVRPGAVRPGAVRPRPGTGRGAPVGPGAGTHAVAALALLGRGSLGVYLAHSAVLALVLAPWAGGAGDRWGSAAVTGLAVAVWAATFAAALAAVVLAPRPGPQTGPEDPQPSERQGRERSSAT